MGGRIPSEVHNRSTTRDRPTLTLALRFSHNNFFWTTVGVAAPYLVSFCTRVPARGSAGQAGVVGEQGDLGTVVEVELAEDS
jgi:hypothetical protein